MDMRLGRQAAIALMAVMAQGCAHITFHDATSATKKNVGVEYYKPKLYLLVTQAEKGYSASILTLPDLTQPRYALLHPGYGSSNLSLKLNNGILTDVGQQADTQIPQTLTALGGLATSAAGLMKSLQVTPPSKTTDGEPAFWLFEIIAEDGRMKLRQVQMVGR
jgi:hypothetical protein